MKRNTLTLTVTPEESLQAALDTARAAIEKAPTDVLVTLTAGAHHLAETVRFDGAGLSDYSITLKGAGAAEIDSLDSFDGSLFTPVAGKPYYACRLPERFCRDGKWINLRTIYINGKMAQLAEGEWHNSVIDEQWIDVNENGERDEADRYLLWVPYALVRDFVAYDEKTGLYSPAGGGFPERMDVALRVQWTYHEMHILGVDYEASNTVKQIPKILGTGEPIEGEYSSTEGHVALMLGNYEGRRFNTAKRSAGPIRNRAPLMLKNNIAFLQHAGEFYYEQERGTLYYIPTEEEARDLSAVTVGIPRLANLFLLKDAQNIAFEGLTFTGTDADAYHRQGYAGGQAGSQYGGVDGFQFVHEGAIVGGSLDGFSVEDCVFTELYQLGIAIYGTSRRIAVKNNRFCELGAGAILLGDGKYAEGVQSNEDVVIENNDLSRIALVFRNNCAICITCVKDAKILHNTIVDCAYTGISVGWCWSQTDKPVGTYFNVMNCEIAYNYIENFMFKMYDGGSIYSLGGNAPIEDETLYNSVHHNYSYCGSTQGHESPAATSTALYHDGGSSHWHTYENLTRVDQSTLCQWNYIALQSGRAGGSQVYRIEVENNYFVDLYQEFLTCGYRRVRPDWYVYERNSHLLTDTPVSEMNPTYRSVVQMHQIDLHGYAPVTEKTAAAINEIATGAGCDGKRGAPLSLSAYREKIVSNSWDLGVGPNTQVDKA